MIAVSDTSPITNLAQIGHFDLMPALFSEILVPSAVWDELNAQGQSWPGAREVASSGAFRRAEVSDRNLVIAFQENLERGESEVLALALETRVERVVLDEAAARETARRFDLRITGVVGLLLESKKRGLIDSVGPKLSALRDRANFYLAETFVRQVLIEAGEMDNELAP